EEALRGLRWVPENHQVRREHHDENRREHEDVHGPRRSEEKRHLGDTLRLDEEEPRAHEEHREVTTASYRVPATDGDERAGDEQHGEQRLEVMHGNRLTGEIQIRPVVARQIASGAELREPRGLERWNCLRAGAGDAHIIEQKSRVEQDARRRAERLAEYLID